MGAARGGGDVECARKVCENLQVGGRLRARETSDMLGMTVLIPLPLPSILVWRDGILVNNNLISQADLGWTSGKLKSYL